MKRISIGVLSAFVAATVGTLAAPAAIAGPNTTHRWSGNAVPNENWTQPLNWEFNDAPAPGDSDTLEFGALANTAQKKQNTNNFAALTARQILFTDSGYNNASRLKGNTVTLNAAGGSTAVSQTVPGLNQIDLPLNLTGAFKQINANPGPCFGGAVIELQQTVTNVGTLTFGGAGRVTVNGNLSGGVVSMQGSGCVVLNGPAGGLGGDFVFGSGILEINNSFGAGAVTSGGGTISGTGNLSGGLNINGTLAPGRIDGPAVGTLTTSGPTDLSGGNFAVDVAGTGNCDKLVTGGSVNLSGTNLLLNPAANLPLIAPGSFTCVIIDKTSGGPVTGTFANAPGGQITVGSQTFEVVYNCNGNDVCIRKFANVPPPPPPVLNTTTTVTSCNATTCTVSVVDSNNAPVAAGGYVSCSSNGSAFGTAPGGVAQIGGGGVAVVPVSGVEGANTVRCQFNGSATNNPSLSVPFGYNVAGASAPTTVSCVRNSANAVTATVTRTGALAPTGFVSFGVDTNANGFLDGAEVTASAPLSSPVGNTASAVGTPVAAANVRCQYNGSGAAPLANPSVSTPV